MNRKARHIVSLLCVVIQMSAAAQVRKVMNRPYIDTRPYHYGFLFGMNMMDLEFENNGYVDADGNQWFAEVPHYDPGFSVGILGELRLSKYFACRLVPTMHFGTKTVMFRNFNANPDAKRTDSQQIRSAYFSVPVDVKFSAERFNNYRPYMMAGVNPVFDLTVKKNKNLLMRKFDCFVEIGMGCDFYLPFFKFIPEIKFCYGLSNVIDKDRSDLTDSSLRIFTQSVDAATSKMVVVSLYFE